MRTIYQIFLAGLLLLLLFLVKDDLRSAYSHFLTYLGSKVDSSELISNTVDRISTGVNSSGTVDEKDTTKGVSTPGALRVVDALVNKNAATLSKDNIIKETNLNRKENGDLPELKENSKLDLSAENKLQDLFAKQYFEHVSPSGVSITDLAKQVGYEYILIGENLAMGNFKDDQALLDAWMASPGHRANILNKNYTEIGVAVGKGKFEGKNVWMAVQHFGTPRSECPTIDQVLFGVIGINQSKIQQMENDLVSEKNKIDSGTLLEGSTYLEEVNSYNKLINIFMFLLNKKNLQRNP